jgi:hypothetical protein
MADSADPRSIAAHLAAALITNAPPENAKSGAAAAAAKIYFEVLAALMNEQKRRYVGGDVLLLLGAEVAHRARDLAEDLSGIEHEHMVAPRRILLLRPIEEPELAGHRARVEEITANSAAPRLPSFGVLRITSKRAASGRFSARRRAKSASTSGRSGILPAALSASMEASAW